MATVRGAGWLGHLLVTDRWSSRAMGQHVVNSLCCRFLLKCLGPLLKKASPCCMVAGLGDGYILQMTWSAGSCWGPLCSHHVVQMQQLCC